MTPERKVVFDNLNSAKENGYDVSFWSVDDIIADLQAFAVDLEECTDEELRPHVEAWKAAQ